MEQNGRFRNSSTLWMSWGIYYLWLSSQGAIFEVMNWCILNAKCYIHNKGLLDENNTEFLHFLYALETRHILIYMVTSSHVFTILVCGVIWVYYSAHTGCPPCRKAGYGTHTLVYYKRTVLLMCDIFLSLYKQYNTSIVVVFFFVFFFIKHEFCLIEMQRFPTICNSKYILSTVTCQHEH